jgi:DNA-binding NarL/FixJ family response regulator
VGNAVLITLVDDHPLFRQALAATIAAADATAQVQQSETLREAMDLIAAGPPPSLLLLDLQLTDSTGVSGLIEVGARFPELRIAVISGQEDPETVASARLAGAVGFVPKTASRSSLIAAVSALLAGQTWFPDTKTPSAQSQWTTAQNRVLDCLKRGLMNKQIAHELGMSEHTVKYHLAGIFRKARCHSRSQLLSVLAGDGNRD